MLDMADRHKVKPLVVRLPAEYREQLKAAAKQNRRSQTEEVKLSLEMYLKSLSLWPPPKTKATKKD